MGVMRKKNDFSKWDEALKNATAKVAEHARAKAREKEAPLYHEDELGRWIKEYPDGRRFEVIHDENGKREIPLE